VLSSQNKAKDSIVNPR